MSIRRDFPDIPPVWAAATLAGQAVVAFTLPMLTFEHWLAPRLAVIVGAAGLGLIGWAAFWFWRKRTTIEPRDTPQTLIVEGPFRVNRNPIYFGMELMLIAAGLWLANAASLALVIAFRLVVTRRFVVGEEAALREAFGAEAEDYIARTRRW